MKLSYYGYKRMNESLRNDLRSAFESILSLDNDDSLFRYQYKNEREIGRFLGRGYAIGTSSGTAALQFSLIALGIGEGDEVITTPHTFIATLLAISNTGARPVLVDILPDTMLIDPGKIEDKITKRTKAIIPVHLYGQMADMDKIMKIAKKHNLYVVEDACQAHLAKYNGRLPGENSDAACYSFFPNKNLGGISNGGMVITKRRQIYRKIEMLRNPTSNSRLVLKSMRTPAYLDWSQIAFIKCKLRYLQSWIHRRRQIAGLYDKGLVGLPIRLPGRDRKAYHTFRDYAIRIQNRGKLSRFLKRKGIETAIHYPEPLHLSETYKHLGYKKGDFPISEMSSNEILSLPINPFLTDNEIGIVLNEIRRFFR